MAFYPGRLDCPRRVTTGPFPIGGPLRVTDAQMAIPRERWLTETDGMTNLFAAGAFWAPSFLNCHSKEQWHALKGALRTLLH